MRPDTGSQTINANASVKIPTGNANYIYCYEQSGLLEIGLFRENREVETHMLERFQSLINKDFDLIEVRDKSAGSNTFRLFFGKGEMLPSADRALVNVDDSTAVRVNMINGSISVSTSLPNNIVPLPDVSAGAAAGLLVAANSGSLIVTLSIPDTALNGIRYGDSTITATDGAWLGPGMSIDIPIENHALYVIRDGANSVTVSASVLERV